MVTGTALRPAATADAIAEMLEMIAATAMVAAMPAVMLVTAAAAVSAAVLMVLVQLGQAAQSVRTVETGNAATDPATAKCAVGCMLLHTRSLTIQGLCLNVCLLRISGTVFC